MLTVFTVMPFSDTLSQIWKDGIEAACHSLGFKSVRADSINKPGFIVDQIFDSIAAADVIIGEMSGSNPNVFYEVGLAHALGKETILLATSSADLNVFDLAGRRHFLHGGDPERTRGYLTTVLAEIETRVAVEMMPPNAVVLYEWPSATFPPPKLTWQSKKEERSLQLDADGGQRICQSDWFGQTICVSNTAELWNHHLGCSIMRLLFTRDLLVGDIMHLLIEARATGRAEIDWAGDGGMVEAAGGQKWASVWHDKTLTIGKGTIWKRWTAAVTVAPTQDGYDLKRGTAVYLLTRSEQHTVLLKRIRLLRRTTS